MMSAFRKQRKEGRGEKAAGLLGGLFRRIAKASCLRKPSADKFASSKGGCRPSTLQTLPDTSYETSRSSDSSSAANCDSCDFTDILVSSIGSRCSEVSWGTGPEGAASCGDSTVDGTGEPAASAASFSSRSPAAVPSNDSSSSVEAAVLSLVFDPLSPPVHAELLKMPRFPGNETVWLVPLGSPNDAGCEEVIVKVVPFHSPERAQQLREAEGYYTTRRAYGNVGGNGGGDEADAFAELHIEDEYIRPEECARYEADMATHINTASAQLSASIDSHSDSDVYVAPLCVLTQPCPLDGGPLSSAHDFQKLLVFPYHPAGDATQYLVSLVDSLEEKMLHPRWVMDRHDAAVTISRELYHMVRDMLGLTARVHRLGHIIADHKLNNMVLDGPANRFKLVDAEAVEYCPRGYLRPGGSLHTEGYAPPEQEADQWVDSRCDVYACGESIVAAMEVVELRLATLLEPTSDAFNRVWDTLLSKVVVLRELAEECKKERPEERPTAQEALIRLIDNSPFPLP
ncbi:hypothetical protein PLESTB_001349500 [Pleodorina starrii]|uniref:Protein kinase domain-containing protein n=1 Tax=Pleodorina starrii TaxID=330485 RepID=A0A9W6F773_9CHLO|nr:hypothetical protein PLESTM_000898500 [Pleodorina starrii]GLC58350.1 hypothetical protein PLESTB_001349500 [Pleodorina starrii]